MPLVRSRSQSSSGIQSTNLFSGFQHWRRRRASNSVPSSPLATSATTNNTTSIPSMVGISRSSSVSESYQPNRLYPATDANEEEDEPSSNPTIHPTNSSQQSTTTELPTTDDQENIHIRLLPNVGLTTRCFIFDIIDRTLTPATILKIGRYSERHAMPDRLSFKSKVVSRTHAELWMEEGKKVFIRDIGSSSGTFVNRIRLSASNEISPPMELKDGDTIQLGVDYQGGMEQIYRSVKIRLEINRNNQKTNSFSRQAFQQLRQRLLGGTDSLPTSSDTGDNQQTSDSGQVTLPQESHIDHNNRTIPSSSSSTGQTNLTSAISQGLPSISSNNNSSYIQECCICLYAIAPLQALFVAPCSHVFHFKCLRPIVFPQYPAFSCPLCRNYYDLEASVAIEVSEVKEALGLSSTTSAKTSPPIEKKPPSSSSSPPTTSSIQHPPLPILASSSIMQNYSPPSSSQQNSHDGDTYSGNDDIQQQSEHEVPERQSNLQQHQQQHVTDGLLLSSTLVDSSMLDQTNGFGNLPSSL